VKMLAVIASTWVLAAASVGCGNMARDVIVEKATATDAGREPAPDASPAPAPRDTSYRCERDGGCPGSRCDPTECSLACPIGCSRRDPGGSTTDYRTRSRRSQSSWRLERP
jgi:hypothetical protein